jgi:DNA polymerase-3 subunit delta
MQLSHDSLPLHLKKSLAPIYFVYGEEPLLVQEACDAIRAAAVAQGHGERQVFTVETGFDWDALYASGQSLSLFAEKRFIELRVPTGKPGEAGSRAIAELCENLPTDTRWLVTAGKLERAAREAKWVKAIDKAGAIVPVYALDAVAWPAWVTRRAMSANLKIKPGVAQLLTHHFEGNTLACAQEIEKLSLLFGPGSELGVDDIEGVLCDNARFSVFALADGCLAGEAARARRILESLKTDGTEPVLVLWALTREIRELATMAAELAQGGTLAEILESHRVWTKRKPSVSQALKRLPPAAWPQLLQRAARVDRVIKGRLRGSAWRELECLALGFSGVRSRTCAAL